MPLLSCPRCKHANPPGSRFCNVCGASLPGGGPVPEPDVVHAPVVARQEELFADVTASAPKPVPDAAAPAFKVQFAPDGSVQLSIVHGKAESHAAHEAAAPHRPVAAASGHELGDEPVPARSAAPLAEPALTREFEAPSKPALPPIDVDEPPTRVRPPGLPSTSSVPPAVFVPAVSAGWKPRVRTAAVIAGAAVLVVAAGAWWGLGGKGAAQTPSGASSADFGDATRPPVPAAVPVPIDRSSTAGNSTVTEVAAVPTEPADLIDRAPASAGPAASEAAPVLMPPVIVPPVSTAAAPAEFAPADRGANPAAVTNAVGGRGHATKVVHDAGRIAKRARAATRNTHGVRAGAVKPVPSAAPPGTKVAAKSGKAAASGKTVTRRAAGSAALPRSASTVSAKPVASAAAARAKSAPP